MGWILWPSEWFSSLMVSSDLRARWRHKPMHNYHWSQLLVLFSDGPFIYLSRLQNKSCDMSRFAIVICSYCSRIMLKILSFVSIWFSCLWKWWITCVGRSRKLKIEQILQLRSLKVMEAFKEKVRCLLWYCFSSPVYILMNMRCNCCWCRVRYSTPQLVQWRLKCSWTTCYWYAGRLCFEVWWQDGVRK